MSLKYSINTRPKCIYFAKIDTKSMPIFGDKGYVCSENYVYSKSPRVRTCVFSSYAKQVLT